MKASNASSWPLHIFPTPHLFLTACLKVQKFSLLGDVPVDNSTFYWQSIKRFGTCRLHIWWDQGLHTSSEKISIISCFLILPFKYDSNHLMARGSKQRAPNFWWKISWSTVSNAFCKSISKPCQYQPIIFFLPDWKFQWVPVQWSNSLGSGRSRL